MIGLALLLAAAEWTARHSRRLEDLTWKDGWIIGFWQALALVPGSSRSGTTLTGGLWRGLRREDAARYSFLLSIPATTAALSRKRGTSSPESSPRSTATKSPISTSAATNRVR